MTKRMTLGMALCLSLSLGVSAPKPKGGDGLGPYLPTAVGDQRVFEATVDGKATELPEWVTAVEAKGGMTVVSFTREEGGPMQYQYGVSSDGVFRVLLLGKVLDPPHRLLKLPPNEGESWEVPLSSPGKPARRAEYTTGKEEEVEVPAGRYKAVRVDMVEVGEGAMPGGMTYWHAPGAGMVKVVTELDRGRHHVLVLKSFTPGSKK